MLYWGIILFICIIVFVVSLKALNKSCWDSTLYLVSTLLTGIVAVIIALAMLLTTCEYRSFWLPLKLNEQLLRKCHSHTSLTTIRLSM